MRQVLGEIQDPLENKFIEIVVAIGNFVFDRDLHNDWYRWGFEKNDFLKKGIQLDWTERIFPNFCERMTKFLEQNGGKFLVGNGVSRILSFEIQLFMIPYIFFP